MASRSNVVSNVVCKKCTKEVKVYITCGKCSSTYHPSCVLKINGTYVDMRGTIFCCDVLNRKSCECESKDEEIEKLKRRLTSLNESLYERSLMREVDEDEKEETTNISSNKNSDGDDMTDVEDNVNNSKYLNAIIDQKDILILELRDKIEILKRHISLLEKLEGRLDDGKNSKQTDSTQLHTSKGPAVITVKSSKIVNKKKSAISMVEDNKKNPIKMKTNNTWSPGVEMNSAAPSDVDRNDETMMTAGTDGATHLFNKRRQKIRRNDEDKLPTKRQVITGSREDEGDFKGADRLAWLYVGNVNNNTKEGNIQKFLENQFENKNFIIEEIKKHESNHSKKKSFKVGFAFEILEDVVKQEIWPKGVVVRRYKFFRNKTLIKTRI